ncbi:Lrp/AsnC family transcriptional regulator [Streptomyces sp. T028]|uniref:Lrp/AsnC family transcriptional regulator n=1 Tax=Streptomyces sp. T028 TaxID=3394379 RepID=UPI003A8445A9
MADAQSLDSLDIDLLRSLRDNPRAGVLELSRTLKVARGTVQARLDRMERTGVIAGFGPELNVGTAGFPVQAFVTLEIAQGALDDVTAACRPAHRAGGVRDYGGL